MSAIIVTRGDVNLAPIRETIPKEWEILQWANGNRLIKLAFDGTQWRTEVSEWVDVPDLSVYGRYAAIQYASHDLIWVQDDDCIVSDPGAIVRAWHDYQEFKHSLAETPQGIIVANMPQEFRPHYPDSCLVGFGACFHRDLPARAFKRFREGIDGDDLNALGREADWNPKIRRTCDVVFTTLTPRVLVDVPVEVLPYAHDSNRMWKQPDHYGERTRVLEMARKVRDA